MKNDSTNWDINKIMRIYNGKSGNDRLDLEFYVQRAGEQWNGKQRSYLMHSILSEYPVPPLLIAKETLPPEEEGKKETNIYHVIDGKQRIESIINFIGSKNGTAYKLDKTTPVVNIDDEEIVLSEMRFIDLSPDVQAKIKAFKFNVFVVSDYSSDEIEDLFSRWNSGTPLSNSQKLKAGFGGEMINFINDEIISTPFFMDTAQYNKSQSKKEEVYTSIAQCMMVIRGILDFNSLNARDVEKFMDKLKEDMNGDFDLFLKGLGKEMKDTTDYLSKAFDCVTEDIYIKKTNIPIMYYVANQALADGITPEQYLKFHNDFFSKYTPGEGYAAYCNAGSTSKEKVKGRMDYMMDAYKEYFQKELKDKNINYVLLNETIKEDDNQTDTENIDTQESNIPQAPVKEEDFDY